MALTIASNVTSLNAQNNLSRASSALSTSVERLSSGLKINRGADGPAALVISEKQRAQIAGLQQAIDNSSKAVSLVQTAEGALSEVNDLLVKVRSLALDSANTGVNDDEALAANQAEINNALSTINRIASNTQFGTKKLLNGSAGGMTATSSDSDVTVLGSTSDTKAGNYSINVTSVGSQAVIGTIFPPGGLGQDETLTINGVDVFFAAGTTESQYISQLNNATDQTGVTAKLDSTGVTVLATVLWGSTATLSVSSDVVPNPGSTGYGTVPITSHGWDATVSINGDSFTSTGTTVESGTTITATSGNAKGLKIQLGFFSPDDVNRTTVYGSQGTVTVKDSSLEFQIGANQNQTAKLGIRNIDSSALGTGVSGNQFSSLSMIDVSTGAKAQDSIEIIDKAISEVANQRSDLGAFQQNTLTATSNNLRTTLENTINAESIVRDTDFASEIAKYTKNQVLVQAGTSILANANQMPQTILSLLR